MATWISAILLGSKGSWSRDLLWDRAATTPRGSRRPDRTIRLTQYLVHVPRSRSADEFTGSRIIFSALYQAHGPGVCIPRPHPSTTTTGGMFRATGTGKSSAAGSGQQRASCGRPGFFSTALESEPCESCCLPVEPPESPDCVRSRAYVHMRLITLASHARSTMRPVCGVAPPACRSRQLLNTHRSTTHIFVIVTVTAVDE